MRNLPLLLAMFIAIALPVLAEEEDCVLKPQADVARCLKEQCNAKMTEAKKELQQCKDNYPNPTGAYVALSLLFVLFFVLFVLVMIDAFVLNKLFKRAKGGSDG